LQAHLNLFARRRRQILADVIRTNGQFAMPAIDQHCKLDAGRSPERTDGIHGRANGAASVKNVINNNDRAALQWQWKFRCAHHR
jgi:hypothetical protein